MGVHFLAVIFHATPDVTKTNPGPDCRAVSNGTNPAKACIRKGVVDMSFFADQPEVLVYGMMSALLAAGTWLLLASYMGWPVSTSAKPAPITDTMGPARFKAQAQNWPRCERKVLKLWINNQAWTYFCPPGIG